MRFSKWAIGLLDDGDDDGEITRFPFSVFIVSDMLELAQAHASFRFIISEEETGDQKLYASIVSVPHVDVRLTTDVALVIQRLHICIVLQAYPYLRPNVTTPLVIHCLPGLGEEKRKVA